MPEPAASRLAADSISSQRFDNLVADVIASLEAGDEVDVALATQDCPELREPLEQLLPTLEAMAELGHSLSRRDPRELRRATSNNKSAASPPMAGVLGDFQIVKEIGRGGMGVVYEAEQISLQRRVALKMLPFAAMLDQQQLNRFKNEARAAATLDHPNIVAVYSIGAERGVHFFAMQLIEGQSLAEVVAELRNAAGGVRNNGAQNSAGEHSAPRISQSEIDTSPVAALSTRPKSNTREYFESVARLGIQAAEALDHAHQNGIVHRDVKPANLLVDVARKLWVTDFGLARIEADAGVTMTGDLLGTLRYMSPEQALAKRVVVDHRTDIYSLGATLYELLALRPAYASVDRQELLSQIAIEDPPKLHKLNPHIPVDLETIVAKAMEKDPDDRYATARELADDLQRYLDVRPVLATRPTAWQHGQRWIRRHQTTARAVGLTVLIAALLGLLIIARAYQRERRQRKLTAVNAERAVASEKRAQDEARRAESNLANALATLDHLYSLIIAARPDYDVAHFFLMNRSVGLRLSVAEPLSEKERLFVQTYLSFYDDIAAVNRGHTRLLRDRANACTRIGNVYSRLGMQWQAMAMYDDALRAAQHLIQQDGANAASELLQLKIVVDSGVEQFRAGRITAGEKTLLEVKAVLEQARKRRPADAVINWELCRTLGWLARLWAGQVGEETDQPRPQRRAGRTFRTAIELWEDYESSRGESSSNTLFDELKIARFGCALYMSYAVYLEASGALREAVTASRQAVIVAERFATEPAARFAYLDRALATSCLGLRLANAQQWDAAEPVLRRAISVWRRSYEETGRTNGARSFARVQHALASGYLDRGRVDEAGAILHEWPIWVAPSAQMINARVDLLQSLGDGNASSIQFWDSLVAADPTDPIRRALRGDFHYGVERYDLAERDFDKAVSLAPREASFVFLRAYFHERCGRFVEAIEDYERAIRLNPSFPHSYNRVAWILATRGMDKPFDYQSALVKIERALQIIPDSEGFVNTLGAVQYRAGLWDKAIATIEASQELSPLNAWDTIFLSMAHAQIGNQSLGLEFYQQTRTNIEFQTANNAKDVLGELHRLCAEAEELLGISRETSISSDGSND